MLNHFVDDIKRIEDELKACIADIAKSEMKEIRFFSEYGKKIGGMYGTASTLELVELANYIRALKEMSDAYALYPNPIAATRVYHLLSDSIGLFDRICNSIHNPEESKALHFVLGVETVKAEKVIRRFFPQTRSAPPKKTDTTRSSGK